MTVDLLQEAIRRRRGVAVVTGETGTGKTRLCRTLAAQVGPSTFTAFLQGPVHSEEQLLVGIDQVLDLARLEVDGTPLLQIILVGHTGFQTALRAPELADLDARVFTRHQLEALPVETPPQEFRVPLVVAGIVVLVASALAVGVSTIVYERMGF